MSLQRHDIRILFVQNPPYSASQVWSQISTFSHYLLIFWCSWREKNVSFKFWKSMDSTQFHVFWWCTDEFPLTLAPDRQSLKWIYSLSWWLSDKESICQCWRPWRLRFELGRSSGGENGNPLQYSCLDNPMDREAWWATVHEVSKESDTT